MSALPLKADMFGVELDVCFVQQADISVCRATVSRLRSWVEYAAGWAPLPALH
jgi:hypothetical protein